MSKLVLKPEGLNGKIGKLKDLQNTVQEAMKDQTQDLKSKGLVSTEVLQIKQEYINIISNLDKLFTSTITFLENTSDTIQEADKKMAEQSENTPQPKEV